MITQKRWKCNIWDCSKKGNINLHTIWQGITRNAWNESLSKCGKSWQYARSLILCTWGKISTMVNRSIVTETINSDRRWKLCKTVLYLNRCYHIDKRWDTCMVLHAVYASKRGVFINSRTKPNRLFVLLACHNPLNFWYVVSFVKTFVTFDTKRC